MHKITTTKPSASKPTAVKGSYILFSRQGKKSKYWGIVTSVNSNYAGTVTGYNVVRPGTGEVMTVPANRLVRVAAKGETITITHG